jgi:hypothetical protein
MNQPFFVVEALIEQRDAGSLVTRTTRWDTLPVSMRSLAEADLADTLAGYERSGYSVRRGLGWGTAVNAFETFTFSVERRTPEQVREAYDAQEAAEAQADAEYDGWINR